VRADGPGEGDCRHPATPPCQPDRVPNATAIDDETTIVVTTTTAVSPVQVWDVLVGRIGDWWGEPYLDPHDGCMHLEARLGGRLWAGPTDAPEGRLHGTVRAFEPPRRLEIGDVLVPGAYTGRVVIMVEGDGSGSSIRIEQRVRGRIAARTEERMEHGWSRMAAALAGLAEQ
jgi:uncharacterized protein YndB with AHSA1/START domain